MKSRYFLFVILLLSISFILFALYLQLVWRILPCPLCVLQRYAFIAVAGCCVIGLFIKKVRVAVLSALLFSLTGMGVAAYQLWVIAHPAVQCGRDPLEAAINALWPAKWLPVLFHSDSLCGDVLDPILGLTPPQWSLVWFFIFALVFAGLIRRE